MTVELSPAGATREKQTRCGVCRRKHWNHRGFCDRCLSGRRTTHSVLCIDDEGKLECVCGMEP